jgi:starch phosphorylase
MTALSYQRDGNLFRPLLDLLLHRDEYLLFADYQSYVDGEDQAGEAFRDRENLSRMAILNVARLGKFSSDRSIDKYCRDVWRISPIASSLVHHT